MAVKFLTGIDLYGAVDLNQFELQNAVIQNLAAAPTTPAPVAGQIYYDTVLDKLRIYTGAAWLTMPDGTGANDFLTGLAFNTGNGILTATVSNQANVTVDLDGRYALSSAIPSVGDGTLTVQGTGVLGGSGTFTANQAGNTTISVTHDNVTRTDPSASTLSSNVFTFVDSITTSAQGHVTAVDTKTVTVPDNNDNTTYELFGVGSTNGTAGVQLDGSDGTLDNVLIVGAGTSSVTRSGNTLTVTSNDQYDGTITGVTAGDGMTGGGTSGTVTLNVIGGDGITANANDIEVDGTVIRTTGAQTLGDTKTFTSNVIIPVTPTLAANAASKSYVDSTLAGSGALIFQGGYNAATNTPDLDVSPSASIKQGWTYAVTTAGNFFAEAVEDGDLLIAESDAPTSLADWTVVQNNIGVATAGSTDGGTTKGIAGFNSAHFNVTSNGWVSSDIYGGGSSLGIVPSGGAAGTLLNGAGGWTAAYSLPEATATVRGGIELFSNTDQSVAANSVSSTAGRTYGSQLNSAGQLVVNVPWTDNNTTYSMMTATTLGLGKLEDNTTQLVAANLVSSTASRTYGIQKNSSNQLVVNVPWTDSTPVDTVTASTAADLDGLKVTPTVGNVVVGLDIDSLTTLSTANPAEHLIIMDETGANKKITIEDVALAGNQSTSYSKLGPPTASTSFTITNGNHGLGTNSEIIMVQLVEVATGETVHADVVRGASGLITITFGAAQSINAYRALLVKVG
jgi:hypothetical protein